MRIPELRVALIESVAKARACWFVLRGCPKPVRPATPEHLAALISIAYRRTPFTVPFVLEAISYQATRSGADGWFAPGAPELPGESVALLHAGLGLGVARAALRGARGRGDDVAKRVDRFLAEIEARALPEFAPICFEALGLVLRVLHRRHLDAALARLTAIDPRLAHLAAHGVGRANYFGLGCALPIAGSAWLGIRRCRSEIKDRCLCEEAEKGVIFAFVFVTLYSPEVTEHLLARHGDDLERSASWMPGMTAALLVRALTVAGDPGLEAFLDHRPAPALAERWRRLVSDPGRAWLGALRAELESAGALRAERESAGALRAERQ